MSRRETRAHACAKFELARMLRHAHPDCRTYLEYFVFPQHCDGGFLNAIDAHLDDFAGVLVKAMPFEGMFVLPPKDPSTRQFFAESHMPSGAAACLGKAKCTNCRLGQHLVAASTQLAAAAGQENWSPTYAQCVEAHFNMAAAFCCDLVMVDARGRVCLILEVVHTSPVDDAKLAKLHALPLTVRMCEIRAERVLQYDVAAWPNVQELCAQASDLRVKVPRALTPPKEAAGGGKPAFMAPMEPAPAAPTAPTAPTATTANTTCTGTPPLAPLAPFAPFAPFAPVSGFKRPRSPLIASEPADTVAFRTAVSALLTQGRVGMVRGRRLALKDLKAYVQTVWPGHIPVGPALHWCVYRHFRAHNYEVTFDTKSKTFDGLCLV